MRSSETGTKPPSPWSVRGVSREARAKASKAAARRRETVGEWVTNVLTEAANDQLGTGARASLGGTLGTRETDQASQLHNTVNALARRVDESERREETLVALAARLEQSGQDERAVTAMSDQAAGIEQLARAFLSLAERLEHTDQRERAILELLESLVERVERNQKRIEGIGARLDDAAGLKQQSEHQQAESAAGMRALEATIRRLADRLPPVDSPGPSAAARPAPAPEAPPAQPTTRPVETAPHQAKHEPEPEPEPEPEREPEPEAALEVEAAPAAAPRRVHGDDTADEADEGGHTVGIDALHDDDAQHEPDAHDAIADPRDKPASAAAEAIAMPPPPEPPEHEPAPEPEPPAKPADAAPEKPSVEPNASGSPPDEGRGGPMDDDAGDERAYVSRPQAGDAQRYPVPARTAQPTAEEPLDTGAFHFDYTELHRRALGNTDARLERRKGARRLFGLPRHKT